VQKRRALSILLILAVCFSMLQGLTFSAMAEGEDPVPDPAPIPIYMDPSYSFAERAADLVARMNLEQKASQVISQNAPAITAAELGGGALNVPATEGIATYTWWQETLHGYQGASNSVSYPQNATVGNTWNPDLYYQVATEISNEIRERAPQRGVTTEGRQNATNLNFYSPTVNMHRDPRWGRNEESYSEDVYLMSRMGTAFVQGMQGMDRNGNLLDPAGRRKVNTTLKHYVANNSENNRLNGGAVSSLRELREYYAAPYRNIIQAADVSSIMTAYSTMNGDPCTWSSYLLDTLLRQTYGFSGHITGDCDSVATISRHNFTNPYTGKVLTIVEQFSQAMAHGVDLECNGGHGSGSNNYRSLMPQMIAQEVETDKGRFTENQLDISLHRLMTSRMELGEWDSDNIYTKEAAARIAQQSGSIGWQTPERLKLIEDVNAEGVVMLKNEAPAGSEEKILPLNIPTSGEYKVVIVGAWQTNSYLGLYSGIQSNTTNRILIRDRIVSNIQEINPDATFTYLTSYGNSTSSSSYTITEQDRATIADADVVIVVVGTPQDYSREDGDRASIVFNNGQDLLISNVGKINPNTIACMETCGPMQVTTFENDVAAILWSSYQGFRKTGFGDVITGKVNPSGKLADTWYKNVSNTGVSDIPSIYDYELFPSEGKQGRTYMYFTGTPSYPFGYGLSFTTFEYSNLKIEKNGSAATEFDANDTITVSFDVTNTGTVKGKETTQLYVAQPEAPAELKRPIKRLFGFQKIELEPGETKTVTLEVKIPDLAFYNEELDRFVVDTGSYEIQVGTNSADVPLKGRINVSGSMKVVPKVLTAKPSQEGDEAIGVEERLIFDKNKIVNPKLTVAMNDESLYGYIIKQQSSLVKQKQSTPFPEGMTFTYESNRPSVVSVTEDNGEYVIKTVGPGVATITATATYNGESVSTEFVVYVVSSPYLDNITVDGVPIEGFKKDKLDYSIKVPAGTTTVPVIEPVSESDDLEITVVQEIQAIPGIKIIRSENKLTHEVAVYRIGVGCEPVETDFTKGEAEALAKGWYFINRNDNAVFGEAGLTITTERGTFSNPEAKPKNVFMMSAMGDWVAQTQVKFDPIPGVRNQQGGLIIYDDDNNYIRFVYGWSASGSTNVVRVYNVVNGSETQSYSANLASASGVYLQIVKNGNTYTFKYSQNGINWTTFGTITAGYVLPQIGLYATNGDTDAAPINVTFEKLSIYELSELYPRLSSISIDGVPLAEFNPEVFDYNIEIDPDSTKIPEISATAANPDYIIEYKQLTTPMGTATVTVYSAVASTTYSINFNTVPISDYFADGNMNPNWTVLRENKNTYSLEKGFGLRLPTQRYDIYGSSHDPWENLFIQSALGNWEVVAKVFYPHVPTANYQQAMLLVWQDEDNYIRANCQQSSLRYEPGIERGGSFNSTAGGSAVAAADGTVTLYHRIRKDGNEYTISVSQDGENFTQLGNPITADFKDPKLGMFATQNSSGSQMNTYFEYITVTELNGVKQKSYQEMLQDAVDNVMKYVAESVPAEISSDLELAPVPHGYSVSVICSDPSVISEDGKVTPPVLADKEVTLRIVITEDGSDRTATSDNIPVTVKAVQPEVNLALPTGPSVILPEEEFTVILSIDTVSQDVYAEDITLSYDPEVLEYIGTTGAKDDIKILRSEASDGTVRILAANIGGANGNNVQILNTKFKVKSGVQGVSSTISVVRGKLGIMPGGVTIDADLGSININVLAPADKAELLAAIQAAQALYESAPEGNEPGMYPPEAKATFLAAINAAQGVYDDPYATQAEVDNAVAALAAARQTFEDSRIPEPGVDKSALQAAITAAEALYDSAVVGYEDGCYLQVDKDIFKAAIDAAKAVYEDPDATQTEVNAAVTALNEAKAAFEASVITPATGDLNNSSSVDVGDLAIAAYYYGKDSDDENWDAIKAADINKDGKIDIEDLAFIAYRVLLK